MARRSWVIRPVPAAAISRGPGDGGQQQGDPDRQPHLGAQEAELHGLRVLRDEDHQHDQGEHPGDQGSADAADPGAQYGAVRSGRAGRARGGTVGGRDGRGRAAPGGGEVCAGMALFPFQGQGQAEARAPRAPIVAGAGRWAVPRSPRLRRSGVAPQPPADVQGAACDGDDDQGWYRPGVGREPRAGGNPMAPGWSCCRRTAIPGIAAPPTRSLPEPAPAYRTAGVEAQCPAGGTPEVVPVTPPPCGNRAWPRDGFAGAGSWLRLGLAACRAGLCRAAGEAHLIVSGSAVTPAG